MHPQDQLQLIDCIGCDNRLQIPKLRGTIKVTCPDCKSQWDVYTGSPTAVGQAKSEAPLPSPNASIRGQNQERGWHSGGYRSLNREDFEKVALVTISAVKGRFGTLRDLPLELANTVANIYFRYFETSVESGPELPHKEWSNRIADRETIPEAIDAYRDLAKEVEKGNVPAHLLPITTRYYLDVFKFRMLGAERKIPLRRMIERMFLKSQDIPNLVESLGLY